jgi:hypothetical protein
MTERKPHPDNDLIDQYEQDSMPTAQGSTSGGQVNQRVGSRAEENAAEGVLVGDEVERATGADNPAQDELKGDKTIDRLRETQSG